MSMHRNFVKDNSKHGGKESYRQSIILQFSLPQFLETTTNCFPLDPAYAFLNK